MLIIHLSIKLVFIECNHVQGHLKGTETDIIPPLVDFMVYCNAFNVWLNSFIRKIFLEATISICIVIYKLHACTILLIYQVHKIHLKRNIKKVLIMEPQMQPMSTCYPCGKLSPVGETGIESLERKMFV